MIPVLIILALIIILPSILGVSVPNTTDPVSSQAEVVKNVVAVAPVEIAPEPYMNQAAAAKVAASIFSLKPIIAQEV